MNIHLIDYHSPTKGYKVPANSVIYGVIDTLNNITYTENLEKILIPVENDVLRHLTDIKRLFAVRFEPIKVFNYLNPIGNSYFFEINTASYLFNPAPALAYLKLIVCTK